MKLFKRIGLFLLIGIVIFYISFSLFKGTRSLSEVPANPAFDDINFYKCVVDAYNVINNETIDYSYNLSDNDLSSITYMYCHDWSLPDDEKTSSIKGIEKLNSLTNLSLSGTLLKEIDLSKNVNLEEFSASDNENLINVNVSENLELKYLNLDRNKLSTIDVSKNLKLQSLSLNGNMLKEINLDNNLDLRILDINFNELTAIDVSKNLKLQGLDLSANMLNELDISKNLDLLFLTVVDNSLKKLNLNNNLELMHLYVSGNELESLDLKNNTKLVKFVSSNNPMDGLYKIYKGEQVCLKNSIQFPNNIDLNLFDFESENNDIVSVDNKGIITAKKNGMIYIRKYIENDTLEYDVYSDVEVIEITSDKYLIDNNNDMIGVDFESVSYEEFISNIDVPDDISIKIFDEDNEIKNGNVSLGMKLKVYYNDEILNVFDIIGEYLKFDEDLIVKDEYISNISVGTSVSDLLESIDTSGNVSVYDKDGNVITDDKLISTGSIVKIVMNNKIIEYNLSVNGDVDGDGKLGLSDIMKISKYVYVDKNSLSDIYLVAADYNMDNKYNLQDIIKIANKIYKGGN